MNKLLTIWAVCFTCAFIFAISSKVFDLAAAGIADHITKGALQVEDHILRKLSSGLGNYQAITQHISTKLHDKNYTFDQFKEDEKGRTDYELKIIGMVLKAVASYRSGQ